MPAVKVVRETRMEGIKATAKKSGEKPDNGSEDETDEGGDKEADNEDDYRPTPAAGVWAGSKKLEYEADATYKFYQKFHQKCFIFMSHKEMNLMLIIHKGPFLSFCHWLSLVYHLWVLFRKWQFVS